MVLVCVGSENPTKVAGVKRAFEALMGSVEVRGFAVPTEVPEQPLGLDAILRGARERALGALRRDPRCSFGVGVEAGFVAVSGEHYDIHAAYVVDGRGRGSYGFSPAFLVPRRFVDLIASGAFRSLEEVVDNYYGTRRIGEHGGFIKLLTRGAIAREELVYYAVAMALVPLTNPHLYSEG